MNRLRVLVSDDHAVVRRGLRALLEAQPGWVVCGEAVNGHEAVRKAKALKPDIVIMDITMPGSNGLEATSKILKNTPDARVLILSMHEAPEVIERVLASGARGFVLKSDAERDLVEAVKTLNEGRTFYTPTASELMLEHFRDEPQGDAKTAMSDRRLSLREREIVQLIAEGISNKQIATTLNVSVRTIETHRAKIMSKLHCKSLTDLVRYAIRNRMVPL